MRLLLWGVALVLLSGCAQTPPGRVKGSATYLERVALPDDAVLEATLEDVSKADAKAEVLGRARVERPGNPPIAFEIVYDPARVDLRGRYVVRAHIASGGKLLFVTDRSFPVFTHGQEVALTLVRAGTPGQAALENTTGSSSSSAATAWPGATSSRASSSRSARWPPR